jgi:Zn-finger nucleic acid-binding protein
MASLTCPTCRVVLQLPANSTASAVRCPKCKGVIPVNGAAQPAPPKPAPQEPAADLLAVTCPSCAKTLRTRAALAGKLIRCPGCQNPVRVPGGVAEPATAAVGVAGPRPATKPASRPARDAEDEEDDNRTERRRPRPADSRKAGGSPVTPVRAGEDPFEGLDVPEKMQEGIRKELEDDEQIVWVGRPMTEIVMKKARFAFFLGIAMAVVGVSAMVVGAAVGHQVVLLLTLCLGGFLTLISIPCMLAPFLLGRFNHKRACYVVTGRRAIIYHGGLLGARSYDRRQLMVHLDRQDSSWAEGAGSLIFEVVISHHVVNSGGPSRRGQHAHVHEDKTEHGFLDVAQVAEVEKLIRDTIIKRKPGQAEEGPRADAVQKPAAAAPPNKQGRPAAEDDNVRPIRRGGSSLSDDEWQEAEGGRAAAGDSADVVEASEVHDKLKPQILNRLTDDERAVWVGRPLPRLVLLRAVPPAVITMVFAVGMAIFLLASGTFNNWPIFLCLGVVFLTGLLMPGYRWLRAQHTAYVLTNRRCLVFEPNAFGMPKVAVYMPDIVSRMKKSGSWFHKGGGDLIFRTVTVVTTTHYRDRRSGASRGSSSSVSETHYGFLAIDDVARVEKLINRNLVEPYLDRVHGV